MNTITDNDIHQQIQQLLPWFINQTLAQPEQQQVEQHLKQCLVCRREWLDLQKLAEQITAHGDLEAAAAASFARLRTQLGKQQSVAAVTTTPHQPAKANRRHQIAAIASLSLAASLLLLIGPSISPTNTTMVNHDFTTLSTSRPAMAEQGLLRVVFAKDIANDKIFELLAQIQAQTIDQANSVGAYTIRLDAASQLTTAQALALLRSHSEVLLAEPVQQ